MKIKHQTFLFLFLLTLLATSCTVQERSKSSIVNLASVDITIHYQIIWGGTGHYSITLSPHQEFVTYQRESTYYIGSHIDDTPNLVISVDSITSSLGKAVNPLEYEIHKYKKGRVPFNKSVNIVRDSSF